MIGGPAALRALSKMCARVHDFSIAGTVDWGINGIAANLQQIVQILQVKLKFKKRIKGGRGDEMKRGIQ